MVSRGYDTALVARVQAADASLAGVRLGRACVKHGVPVAKAAKELNVSRQTIYSWFTGKTLPRPTDELRIVRYIQEILD